jgi:S-adenosylmethionine decarboxylase
MGVKPLGRHLLLELFECDATALSSLPTVKTSMLEAANRARATIVNHVFHEFSPFGVSGVVVIAESHLAIHTWPEYRFAAVDVFSCGEVLQPQLAAEYLAERFTAGRISVVELGRGLLNQELVEESRPTLAAMPEKAAGA